MIYLIVTSVLLFYSLYMLASILFALLYKAPVYKNEIGKDHTILIFYPAYKADQKLVENLSYMRSQVATINAKFYVLSQDSKIEIDHELEAFSDYFDTKSFSHLKGNSYHHALEFAVTQIEKISKEDQINFDSILIMDPDNTMNLSSIKKLIQGRIHGADVVLSKRASISQNDSISLFDGLSERLNDYMLRRSKHVLGLTPELSGSGMLVETELFTKAILKLDKKAPGMDKQLLINMMFEREDLNIIFDEEAIVYDEKTTDPTSFNRQRLRWFGNQYYNAKKFTFQLISSGKLSLIDYAIVLCRPPRSFQIVGSSALVPLDLMMFYFNLIPFPILTISTFFLGLALVIFLNKESLLLQIIKMIFPMMKTSMINGITVLKSLKSDKEGSFIHTRNK